ncbi:FGGY-family carbohydrate kinase [Microbacterium sp. MPKO10]|uniref:FGGY-family carbohydrate kinase n=1 Tax=Microbacterium sp. MPKO10 TaxID=2989818 RepID=UPI002236945F|nr:FGGY family carbohydrate kinase [Microbacterium sp. MPKO10]MCW4459914.1 FGGY family carbohydrate kinase [Microbacterium sp. MPKO10]
MTQYFLGIDIGTYETKGVLVDTAGAVFATARARHGISTPHPGHVEHDALDVWWSDFTRVSRELVGQLAPDDEILAVSCSAIGPCVLPVDAQLNPLRPAILYGVDTRADEQIADFERRIGADEIFRRSGNTLTSQSAGPKIAWIIENEPEVAEAARWYMTSQSFLVARLTGEVVIDHATAGYYHPFYDLARGCWDLTGFTDLLRVEQLPALRWSSEVAGQVTAEGAADTGVPEGTPVLTGTTDAVAEAIGASVLDDGDLMLMYGSSGYMIRVASEPIADAVLWSAPFAFPGRYVLAAGTSTAGTATRWIADMLGLDEGEGDAALFTELMRLVHDAPVGAGGVVHIPHFSGERTPFHDADARGVFTGISLTTSRADMARAVIEGVAHSVVAAVRSYAEIGMEPKRVMAIGGGTKNDVLVQTVSDLLGFDQNCAATIGAAYGDAILAALGLESTSQADIRDNWVSTDATVEPRASDDPALTTLTRAHDEFIATYRALRGARTAEEETTE